MAVYKKGNRWVADFYLGGRSGRRVRRSAPTRKLAGAVEHDAKLRELRSELGSDEIRHCNPAAIRPIMCRPSDCARTGRTSQHNNYDEVGPFSSGEVERQCGKAEVGIFI
jgi:hypothetical protein